MAEPSYADGYSPRDGAAEFPALQDGLITSICLNLGDSGTTTVPDASGNNNDGSMNGYLPGDWVTDPLGKTELQGAVNKWIDVARPALFNASVGSILAFYRKDTDDAQSVVSNNGYAAANELAIEHERFNNCRGRIAGTLPRFISANLVGDRNLFVLGWDNGTYHVRLIGDAPGSPLYLTGAYTQNTFTNDFQLSRDNFSWFDGRLGNVYFYNRLLSESECLQIAADPVAPHRLAVGAGPTATADLTAAGATFSASGNTIAAPFTATATLVCAGPTFASDATFFLDTYTASAALSTSGSTFTADAKFVPAFSATATLVSAGAEITASGTTTEPAFDGIATLTAGGALSAASATHTGPTYTADAILVAAGARLMATASTSTALRVANAALTAGGADFSAVAEFTPVNTATSADLVAAGAVLAATASFTIGPYVPAEQVYVHQVYIQTPNTIATIQTPYTDAIIETL